MKFFMLVIFLFLVTARITLAVVCDNGDSCDRYECCLLDKSTGLGHCKSMGWTTSDCYAKQPYAYNKPKEMITNFDLCPCVPGEFCAPMSGRTHPVYGPMGICTFG